MSAADQRLAANKAAVTRFNKEVIEGGDEAAFHALMAPHFVNRTALPGTSSGPDGMFDMLLRVMRAAFSGLTVEIHDQIAEGDKVTTRKTIRGTHTGELMGVPATGRQVAIQVIDIVRLEEGRYAEHWGINTLGAVLAELRRPG